MKIIKNKEPMLTLYYNTEEFKRLDKEILEKANFVYLGHYNGETFYISDKNYIIVKDEEEED